jgi:dihydrolipoamide dehydrogenase
MSQTFDVVVIGGGPGGYIAAIRAAQLGFSVACIESWKTPKGEPALGGTCLNVGCIPSKALLHSSELFEEVAHHLGDHGISTGPVKLDLAKMVSKKDGVVTKMTKGVEFLFRKNKIQWLKGHGRFIGRREGAIEVAVHPDVAAAEKADGSAADTVTASEVIIATGSKARHLPGIDVDGRLVCDNEGALAFDSVPGKLAVIGAGVIGLELGSVWRRLGAEVTILEALPSFLGACDAAIAKEAARIFGRQGLKIELGVKIESVATGRKAGVKVRYAGADGAGDKELAADRLIVSVGRVPNTDGLGLEAVGLACDGRGFIPVDENCATAVPGIWAIGDVVRGPMLAHKASDEGAAVAERIGGQKPHVDLNTVPWVIYTMPEIAWVGATEAQVKEEGREYRVGQFPFSANGRAVGMGHTEGFARIIADATSDEVLGVHVIGAGASELIAEAAMAMEFKASSEDIARICHAHPTRAEALREAALAVDERALNI